MVRADARWRPSFVKFFRRSKRATDFEILVTQAILRGSDPRYLLLIDQLRRAPSVEREYPDTDAFRVRPTSSWEDLDFELEVSRIASGWLPVIDRRSGRPLRFRMVVGRHGFILGLEGLTEDGAPWPKDWSVDSEGLSGGPADLLDLPSLEQQRLDDAERRSRLRDWLGSDLQLRSGCTRPRRRPQRRQRGAARRAPAGRVRDFMAFSGADFKDLHLHGHEDIYPLESRRMAGVIAGI